MGPGVGLTGGILLLFVLIYILFASQLVTVTIVLLSAVAIPLYMRHNRQVITSTEEATATRVRLFGAERLLAGFKESACGRSAARICSANTTPLPRPPKDATVRALVREQKSHSFISANFYLLLAFVVFMLPRWVTSGPRLAARCHGGTVLFSWGLSACISFTLPQYERASLAAESLRALEARLDPQARPLPRPRDADPHDAPGPARAAAHRPFLTSPSLTRTRWRAPALPSGPSPSKYTAARSSLFVGGNGSGKTTLLKTLAGLYIPSSGSISGRWRFPLTTTTDRPSRENFAAIFTDFPSLQKLYGLAQSSLNPGLQLLQQLDRSQDRLR